MSYSNQLGFSEEKELKLILNDSIKRIKLPDSYEDLRQMVYNSFPNILNESLILTYLDNEGDKVQISNNDDFILMSSYIRKQDASIMRINIQTNKLSTENNNAIFNEIDPNLNQFIKDFILFCYNNFNKSQQFEKQLNQNSMTSYGLDEVIQVNQDEKIKVLKLKEWIKIFKSLIDPEAYDRFSFSHESLNTITVEKTYKTANGAKKFKNKTITIPFESIDEKWSDELGAQKLENLFEYVYSNFDNDEKNYDLRKF